MADRVGQQLDDYRLVRLLGVGTFGEVYLGEHVYQHTQVAVKVLNLRLTPDTLKDFLNEARIVRLKHSHIIQIVDFGIASNTPFLVMDYAPNAIRKEQYISKKRPSRFVILSAAKDLSPDRDPSLRSG